MDVTAIGEILIDLTQTGVNAAGVPRPPPRGRCPGPPPGGSGSSAPRPRPRTPIKLAEEELPLLAGTADLGEGTRILEERGLSLIMVTLGGEGVFCRWKGEAWKQPGVPAPPSSGGASPQSPRRPPRPDRARSTAFSARHNTPSAIFGRSSRLLGPWRIWSPWRTPAAAGE